MGPFAGMCIKYSICRSPTVTFFFALEEVYEKKTFFFFIFFTSKWQHPESSKNEVLVATEPGKLSKNKKNE